MKNLIPDLYNTTTTIHTSGMLHLDNSINNIYTSNRFIEAMKHI
jgi:hypothetical protein